MDGQTVRRSVISFLFIRPASPSGSRGPRRHSVPSNWSDSPPTTVQSYQADSAPASKLLGKGVNIEGGTMVDGKCHLWIVIRMIQTLI